MEIELGDFAADERYRVMTLGKAATDACEIFERIESREKSIRAIQHPDTRFLSILFENGRGRVGVGEAAGLCPDTAKRMACEILEKAQMTDFIALREVLSDVAKVKYEGD